MANIQPLYEIRQSNALTEARFNLSACQLDIYFYLLSLLKRQDEPERKYEIYVKQIEELTGRQWQYKQLREATKDMLGKVIEFEDNEGNFCQTSLIASAKYIKGSGSIQITVSPLMRPLLWELKDRYTSFQLYCALAMTSKFAKRIYLLCSEWKHNMKENQNVAISKYYSIDEMRYMLGLTDPKGNEPDQYKQWTEFKTYVLEAAKAQINKYSDLKIEYKATKQGRSYGIIQFSIKQNNEHQLLIDFKEENTNERLLQTQRKVYLTEHFKLSDKQAETVVRRFDPAKVKEVLDSIIEAKKAGNVKNIGAYTATAFRNQFGVDI